MIKINLFQAVRNDLKLLGFTREHGGYRFYPFGIRHLVATGILLFGILSIFISAIYLADSPVQNLDLFFMFSVLLTVFISFTNFTLNMSKLFDIFDKCEEICNKELDNPQQKEELDKTNQLTELLSKILCVAVKIGIPGVILPKAVLSFYKYCTTDARNDAFELPILSYFPFDWDNPVGYSIAFIFQCIVAFCVLHYVACFLSALLGAYFIANSLTGFMKNNLQSINKTTKTKTSDIIEPFARFIRSYAELKQLITDFSETVEITVTFLFLSCTIELCIIMLMVQTEISHDKIDYLMIGRLINYGVGVFGCLFFTCELGQRLTNSFGQIGNVINRLEWYLFSIGMQKLLPITIINVQQPVVVKCFGNILCSRDQFQKVLNKAYSYFMVLRKFYK